MATKPRFLSLRRIANNGPDGYPKYLVQSSSGNTYTVAADYEKSHRGGWGCTCPARGNCHHVTAVIEHRAAERDQDARALYNDALNGPDFS